MDPWTWEQGRWTKAGEGAFRVRKDLFSSRVQEICHSPDDDEEEEEEDADDDDDDEEEEEDDADEEEDDDDDDDEDDEDDDDDEDEDGDHEDEDVKTKKHQIGSTKQIFDSWKMCVSKIFWKVCGIYDLWCSHPGFCWMSKLNQPCELADADQVNWTDSRSSQHLPPLWRTPGPIISGLLSPNKNPLFGRICS